MGTTRVLACWNERPEERAIIESVWPPEAEVVFAARRDMESIRPVLETVDAIVGYMAEEWLDLTPRLKLYHVLGHGVDDVFKGKMFVTLAERGVVVARANAGAVCIAEFAILCMLALTRRLTKFHEALAYHGSRNEFLRAERMQGGIGGELYQSTLGIVGFGNIGREIAKRARAFGMTLGAVSRRPERIDKAGFGIEFTATLDEIDPFLSRCNYVALCLPGTPATRDLMDHRRFSAMKDGSYLVNVGRGSLIVEEALWEALRSGKLAGAALDVHRTDHGRDLGGYPFPFPIHQYNVILTPHYSGSTYEARVRALRVVGENLRRLAHGEPLLNLVDFDAGY